MICVFHHVTTRRIIEKCLISLTVCTMRGNTLLWRYSNLLEPFFQGKVEEWREAAEGEVGQDRHDVARRQEEGRQRHPPHRIGRR